VLRRRRDAYERDVGVFDGLIQFRGRAEAGLAELLDPLLADVVEYNLVAELREALASDGSDDPTADYAYFRRLNPLQY